MISRASERLNGTPCRYFSDLLDVAAAATAEEHERVALENVSVGLKLRALRGGGEKVAWGRIVEQIAQWLERLGLGQYANLFADNDIDISVVSHLSDQQH